MISIFNGTLNHYLVWGCLDQVTRVSLYVWLFFCHFISRRNNNKRRYRFYFNFLSRPSFELRYGSSIKSVRLEAVLRGSRLNTSLFSFMKILDTNSSFISYTHFLFWFFVKKFVCPSQRSHVLKLLELVSRTRCRRTKRQNEKVLGHTLHQWINQVWPRTA